MPHKSKTRHLLRCLLDPRYLHAPLILPQNPLPAILSNSILLATLTFVLMMPPSPSLVVPTSGQEASSESTTKANPSKSTKSFSGTYTTEGLATIRTLTRKLRNQRHRHQSERRRLLKFLARFKGWSKRGLHSVDILTTASRQSGVPAELLIAMASTESTGNPGAESDAGAIGLLQVMPFWVKEFPFLQSKQDLFDPRLNARAGIAILQQYCTNAGSLGHCLAKYHGGPTFRHQDAKSYVARILRGTESQASGD